MKRFLAFLLAAVVPLLAACGANTVPAATEMSEQKITEEPAVNTVPEETEQVETEMEGSLYLRASSVSFSLVGESEDIYLGVIPREMVSWVSDDPSIITVENGVLTAVGVGTTTVHAFYLDREVSCAVDCLAQTQEELDILDKEILSKPKRLPPEVDLDEPCTLFDEDAILGDSITFFLMQAEAQNDGLGKVTFLTRNGISIHSLVLHSKNLYFEGHEMFVEDIIPKVAPKRLYILLGCLDFQIPASKMQLMENWNIMLDRIEEACPETEIVLVSNTPGFSEQKKTTEYNEAVSEAVIQLEALAQERGFGYLDLGYYICDHYGRMAADYFQDEFHMNQEGSFVWMKIMRYYRLLELESGAAA